MEYPHPGPNASRITLEGAGGFIYALTPVLILLFTAPLALAALLAAGALVAPLVHWGFSRRSSITSLSGALPGLLLLGALALLLGQHPFFRPAALGCMVAGTLAAVALARRPQAAAVSIRPWANPTR
jgi:hypothetical protein